MDHNEREARRVARARKRAAQRPREVAVLDEVLARTGYRFGTMVVIATDQFFLRRYRCPCGWRGAVVWGHAEHHLLGCRKAQGLDA